jgi:DNA-binding response OmpR family regulator
MEKIKKILLISSDKSLREVLNFCFDGWGYEVYMLDSLVHDLTPIKKISPDVIVVDIHSANKLHLEMCRLFKEDFITAFIPVIALINKKQLRTQLLNLKQGIDDYLIKPPDPLDLRVRVEMAIRRSQYSFYASPLTGLPGSRNIEEVLKERIKKGAPFSFGHLDIDNFKYFNDVYGYLKGDRAIMQSAYMLYTVIRSHGNKDDFMGHIGGDDFVFITTPDKVRPICHNFINTFDRIIPFHYSSEDRKNGFITARDRTHKIKNVPLMSISMAVVSKKGSADFNNIIEVNEKVTEVKRYLKTFTGSKFMEDRRNGKTIESSIPTIYQRVDAAETSYVPLGQMLLEKKVITPEKLDEALTAHWRRGVLFGEILKEFGLIQGDELEKMIKDSRGILCGTSERSM